MERATAGHESPPAICSACTAWLTVSLLGAVLCLMLAGCAATWSNMRAGAGQGVPPSMEEAWGIEIIGIRYSAAGYMLDFRYRVLDSEKAAPVFDRRIKPYLVDQVSGAVFAVPNPPKTGPLRSSNMPKENRNYFIFFGNPGRYIKPGSLVTVVIGDFRAENLVVE